MRHGLEEADVKLLCESVLRSAYYFLLTCYHRVGFVFNLNRFKIMFHLEGGSGRGILTFTTDLVDIQQVLEGILPYRSQLFQKEVNNIQLEEMRMRMNHLPPARFEAVRNLWEEDNRQRGVVRRMLEDLNDSCLIRYRQLPEVDKVEFKIKYFQNDLLWPATIYCWYRNISAGFPFPPPRRERRPADNGHAPQPQRRRMN